MRDSKAIHEARNAMSEEDKAIVDELLNAIETLDALAVELDGCLAGGQELPGWSDEGRGDHV